MFYFTRLLVPLCLFLPVLTSAQLANQGVLHIDDGTTVSVVSAMQNFSTGMVTNDGNAIFYADFENNGIFDYGDGATPHVYFNGNEVQILSGNQVSYFYDLTFNSSEQPLSAFDLSTTFHVGHEASFENGIVKAATSDTRIIFGANASHNSAHSSSFVDGFVEKHGESSFEYPIGHEAHYRSASISAPENTLDVFSSRYYFEDPSDAGQRPLQNLEGIITAIDDAEYWELNRDSGDSEVLVTLTWDEETTPNAVTAAPESAIHILRWDDESQLWLDEGGVVDIPNKSVTTPLSLKSYGIFTLGRVAENLISEDDMVVYNAVSANNDGLNDSFTIKGIENAENNKVVIFNRWGKKVFETVDYGATSNQFRGFSTARLTWNESEKLPSGTYFYNIEYDALREGKSVRVKKTGYLYLTY